MRDRTKMMLLPRLVLAGALLPALLPAQEASGRDLRLEYHQVLVRQLDPTEAGGAVPPAERTETTFAVTLGPRWAAVEADGRVQVWDFDAGVGRTVDVAAGTYREGPLLAHVAFLQMELENRRRLQGVLGAGGLSQAAWSPFELSTLFGWRAAGDEESLQRREVGAAVSFVHGDDVVAGWTPSSQALDEAQQASFGRVLQRRAHLHPEVCSALLASGHAPAQLEFRWRDTGARCEANWTLAQVASPASRVGDCAGLRRDFGDPGLDRLGRLVRGPKSDTTPVRLTRDEFAALAAAARDAGNFPDAVMLLLEASLSTGDPMTGELRDISRITAAKEQIRGLMGAIGKVDTDPKGALEFLDLFDRTTLSRPAVLDVFRANALLGTKRRQQALDLLLATLAQAPWMAMAYKDLGDLYYADFDTGRAWSAWALGRAIAPDHSCWRRLHGYEQQLQQTYAALL